MSRETLRRQAERAADVSPGDRSRAIIEQMRLGALLGERPDVRVGIDSAEFFAGKDPVLAAALEHDRGR